MAEDDEHWEEPPGKPLLDYREGAADRPDDSGKQFFSGMVNSTALLMASVFFGTLLSIYKEKILGVGSVGVALLAVNIWAIFVYRRGRRRAYAIGLWVGIGVAALIEGVCFAANSR
jgi:hypothetical protein